MNFVVGGRPIELTAEDVARAMDGVEPERIREHLVKVDRTLFPPKQVLAKVTGWSRQSFTTMEAQRVLGKLGFACRRVGQLPDGQAGWVPVKGSAALERSSLERPSLVEAGRSTTVPSTHSHGMTVREVLMEGRQKVASALAMGATSGPDPNEETLSWILQSTAAWNSDLVTVRAFTRNEESRYTGADWLWWWEGEPDQWFGCLVQAKRLFMGPNGPTFDFHYRTSRSGADANPPLQVHRLLDASDALDVPAAYLLYRSPVLGQPGAWSCPTIQPEWDTAAATVIAAAIVNEWLALGRPTELEAARPVECLACEGLCGNDLARLAWYAQNLADPVLRRILKAPPTNAARRAFRALFSEVVKLRSTQFRGVPTDIADEMHSGFRLGEHFARGVRRPPEYVTSILSGEDPGDVRELEQLERVAGVVIVSDGS